MKPPESIRKFVKEQLAQLRSTEAQTELVNAVATEVLLCGRIWSDEIVQQLEERYSTLTSSSAIVNSNLRACLSFHDLTEMNNGNWEGLKSLIRNEYLGDKIERLKEEESDAKKKGVKFEKEFNAFQELKQIGLTEIEKQTLTDFDISTEGFTEFESQDDAFNGRKLLHLSLDGIQKVIRENTQQEPETSAYHSICIGKIFREVIGQKAPFNGKICMLYSIGEHSLISADENIEVSEVLSWFEEQMKTRAHDEYLMNLNGLRIRISDARDHVDLDELDKTARTINDNHPLSTKSQKEKKILEIQESEEKKILTWSCERAEGRQKRMAYIDAIQLTQQIWGGRTPLEGFARSIRITPYIDIVFGTVITSFEKLSKQLHGGDDFCLTFNRFSDENKRDLVPQLMQPELKELLGHGRWHFEENADGKLEWEVVGDGFAQPFWWWCIGESEENGYDDSLKERFKNAKESRRDWLTKASRAEIQITLAPDNKE